MNKFKCSACNYEFKQELKKGSYVITLGDKPPIALYLSNNISITIHEDEGDFLSSPKDADLYACPHCHAVKIGNIY